MGRAYYLFRSGRLRRRQNTLYLEWEADGQTQRQAIPVEDVEALFAMGELDLNTRLLSFLGRHGISLHVFNYYGFYVGSFYPRETRAAGQVVVAQALHSADPSRRLALARGFVEGALFHMRRNLLYYRRQGLPVEEPLTAIEQALREIESCPDVPTLMGLEGQARDAYYRAFPAILNLEGFRRSRRPPENPINALLSFGNGLLYAATLSELYHTPLHPAISFLHEPSAGRFSLALDLAELFKPLVVDRMAFTLMNRNALSEEDFLEEVGFCYLKEEGRKKVVAEFEERMRETVQHPRLKRPVSYRTLIRLEAYKLVRHLLGMEPYEPLKAWW
ncbi:type I-B CRISPR-associated endonuclease Cas1b [Thermoflexus hugenholtzii]|uniref:CRISPR-associated endonuclease Cas1 n=1 Tax=Thermoflexus hugenholtzii JAD2 TaxID=877466 RepID=A0A212RML9_9CHLR|nr:type I-B CRISPR-associated endonuclease Cas1b [Thermoflexus hugenholtzii]SNB73808.1 CRISP-associated protein Cas1 [Thermoflexus hugenholtzii JAD2]